MRKGLQKKKSTLCDDRGGSQKSGHTKRFPKKLRRLFLAKSSINLLSGKISLKNKHGLYRVLNVDLNGCPNPKLCFIWGLLHLRVYTHIFLFLLQLLRMFCALDLFHSLIFIFPPIIPAGTLVNLAAKMQRGSCYPPVIPEEPISSERAKPLRVTDDSYSVFLFFFVCLFLCCF